MVKGEDAASCKEIVHSLGLFDDRLKGIIGITQAFLLGGDAFAVDLGENKIRGIGKFGWHSWLIFCRDMGRTLKCEDAALVSYANWRKKQPVEEAGEEEEEEAKEAAEAEEETRASPKVKASPTVKASPKKAHKVEEVAKVKAETVVKKEARASPRARASPSRASPRVRVAEVATVKVAKEEESSSEDEAETIRRLQKKARDAK